MKSDARILDVVATLDDPINYVRGVVENCFTHGFDKQRAVVRIGVSGKGIIPNYAIEQRSEDTPNFDKVLSPDFELRLCFHGRSHKEILEESFQGENWSSTAMSCAEVQTLLGELRRKSKR